MTSSFFDSVHEFKTKVPVNEETPVFMFKLVYCSSTVSPNKGIFCLFVNLFIFNLRLFNLIQTKKVKFLFIFFFLDMFI